MQKYDVVIVGAGPGGLACATELARHNCKVLVLEKNKTIGPKVCAGGITWVGIKKCFPGAVIEKEFPDQHIYSNYQKAILSAPNPIIATVNRHRFGQWMLQQAVNAGASIKTDCRVREIDRNSIKTDNDDYSFDHLVGADGSNSIVRRHLGLVRNRVGIGIQFWVPTTCQAMEWHLSKDFFGPGYGWIFPHSDKTSVGAFSGQGGLSAKQLEDNLIKWAITRGIETNGQKTEAALINYDFQGWRFNNILLVGDAAGLASALTGEGMYPAIISGQSAAKVILKPDCQLPEMNSLLEKHAKHCRYQNIFSTKPLMGRIIGEFLIIALRTGMLQFNALEMGT